MWPRLAETRRRVQELRWCTVWPLQTRPSQGHRCPQLALDGIELSICVSRQPQYLSSSSCHHVLLGQGVNRCPGTPPVEAQGCSRGVCERSRCPLFKMLSTRRGGMKSRSVRLSCFVVLFSSRCRVTAACTNREAGGTRPSRRATQ